MKGFSHNILNRLGFRIIMPIILVTLFTGFILYIFVLRSVSDFADNHIKESFLEMATDIYEVCDRSMNDLLKTGALNNEKTVRIEKGLTIGSIEDFMKRNNLIGFILEGDKAVLSVGDPPSGLSEAIEKVSREHEVNLFTYSGERFYTYHFDFEPWKWHIVLVHHAGDYSTLINKVRISYGITGAILLLSIFLLFYYYNMTFRHPINRIIEKLKKGDRPDYKGITEFEYLNANLKDAMDLREKESKMLNNIYHIAASKRGEEFFNEVAMAIGRMFDHKSLIARVNPDGIHAEVIAYSGDELKKGMSISLKGTPCEGVVEKKHMSVISRDAHKEFPEAEFLALTGSDSYIGVAIFGRKGDVIGIVNSFGKQREFSESDIKVFQTVGQMVATEFEIQEREKEEELIRKELFQAQKMEAIGTLAGGIAHDFNNMLQGVLGYTSLLKMKVPETDPIYKPLSVIENSAERAAELTKQLLGFARKGKYIVEPLNINAVIDEVYKIISRTFDRAIDIKILPEYDLRAIEGDKSQIEHVILNLCLNARDAMPAGGLLLIETSNINAGEGDIPYPWLKTGRYVSIKIKDTGIGMDEEVKRHIFEPFFTTKEKGTGMGLAMVYGVVKNHDGFITVDSDLGKGSTFTIYLPAAERVIMKDEVKETILLRGEGTILVVDDEEFIRLFAKETLERLGYRVQEASNGEEAINVYNNTSKKIDLVILDLIMPKMGGEETFHKLKMIDPHVKVLISSGFGAGEQTKELMKDTCIVGFIQKPYNTTEIAEMVKTALSSA